MGGLIVKISLKEMEEILKKLEEKINWTYGLEETFRQKNNSHQIIKTLQEKIDDINDKITQLKENAIVEMDENTSEIYELLKIESRPSGRVKISEIRDKEIKSKIEKLREDIDKILEKLEK